MKLPTVIFFVLLLFQFAVAQPAEDDKTGSLSLIITGFENDNGEVLIAISNSREDFESDDTAFIEMNVKIENGKVEYTFEELPIGEYAIKLFHDENMDGELDSNFLGIPTEDYGFSNNAKGTFGPADYDDAKFIFNKNKMTIEISVN